MKFRVGGAFSWIRIFDLIFLNEFRRKYNRRAFSTNFRNFEKVSRKLALQNGLCSCQNLLKSFVKKNLIKL